VAKRHGDCPGFTTRKPIPQTVSRAPKGSRILPNRTRRSNLVMQLQARERFSRILGCRVVNCV
jgi:hypothetical protein